MALPGSIEGSGCGPRQRPRVLLALLLLVTGCAASGCWTGAYLAEQGVGQLRLLQQRRRIVEVLADPRVDAETKRRLRLAVAARDFGHRRLGLRTGGAYTRYLDTRGQPVAWMVSAAPKDRLVPHLFRFPFIGALPYAGFFKEASATREVARLERRGLDTSVRAVAGYSTLGITSDPVYSSMLEGSDARIVEITLHEMAHATVFIKGHAEWNESFATLVGLKGAALFFAAHGRAAEARRFAGEAQRREAAQARFAAFLEPVLKDLKALYASPLPRADKLRRRETLFARAKADFARRFPRQPGRPPHPFIAQPLNNAVLVSYAVYHETTPDLRRILARLGDDLPTFIALCRHAAQSQPDPVAYLERL